MSLINGYNRFDSHPITESGRANIIFNCNTSKIYDDVNDILKDVRFVNFKHRFFQEVIDTNRPFCFFLHIIGTAKINTQLTSYLERRKFLNICRRIFNEEPCVLQCELGIKSEFRLHFPQTIVRNKAHYIQVFDKLLNRVPTCYRRCFNNFMNTQQNMMLKLPLAGCPMYCPNKKPKTTCVFNSKGTEEEFDADMITNCMVSLPHLQPRLLSVYGILELENKTTSDVNDEKDDGDQMEHTKYVSILKKRTISPDIENDVSCPAKKERTENNNLLRIQPPSDRCERNRQKLKDILVCDAEKRLNETMTLLKFELGNLDRVEPIHDKCLFESFNSHLFKLYDAMNAMDPGVFQMFLTGLNAIGMNLDGVNKDNNVSLSILFTQMIMFVDPQFDGNIIVERFRRMWFICFIHFPVEMHHVISKSHTLRETKIN